MKAAAILVILPILLSIGESSGFPLGKRLYKTLPSVSDDHFSETSSDGTYRYAYTGPDRFTAERRKRDGTVEGETVYVRPDGVPVRVHYFADSHGYRPRTEVLYAERAAVRVRDGAVVVPNNNDVHIRNAHSDVGVGGGGFDGGDRAIAQPSVTAIVGPGGHAEINPVAIARTNGNKFSRSGGFGGGGGDVAIANPQVHAIVGAGGSVRVNPHATALTDGNDAGSAGIVAYRNSLREYPVVREVVRPVTVVNEVRPVIHRTVVRPPTTIVTERDGGYVYAAPLEPPIMAAVAVPVAVPVHRAQQVVLVPPSSSYEYSYGYSAPDNKHPGFGKNEAYVNVRVNH